MAAVWYRARAELRRDWRTVATLALIFGRQGGLAPGQAHAESGFRGRAAARLRPAEILRTE